MDIFWKILLMTFFWALLLGLQIRNKEAWTQGPVYTKAKNPKTYTFFIALYSTLLFTSILLSIKLGLEYFGK